VILDVALELQESVTWYITRHLREINKGDHLLINDWDLLHIIHKFLSIFKSATLKLEGGCSTLNKVLFIMDLLKLHFAQTLVSHIINPFF